MRVMLDSKIVYAAIFPKSSDIPVQRVFSALSRRADEIWVHPEAWDFIHALSSTKKVPSLFLTFKTVGHPIVLSDTLRNMKDFHHPMNKEEATEIDMLQCLLDGETDYILSDSLLLNNFNQEALFSGKIHTIEKFLQLYYRQFPECIEYNTLSIKRKKIADLDANDPFFLSFRKDYKGFDGWLTRKKDEWCYCSFDDEGLLNGLLYIKSEAEKDDYSNIEPIFTPAHRLKVGTFKTISSGFRLGERFLKIIFDNAIQRGVDEIYVTMFENRDELRVLRSFFEKWGFHFYGHKIDTKEIVLVKKMSFDATQKPRENFPLYNPNAPKHYLPIYPEFHTSLFPDSILNTENFEDYEDKKAYQYALQKVYVTFAAMKVVKPGDLIVIYRTGGSYVGVLTTLCVVDEFLKPQTLEEFLKECENRSIFSHEQLCEFWSRKPQIVKLLPLKSFKKRVVINKLWDLGIIEYGKGPRPFDLINDKVFSTIMKLTERD